MPAPDAATIFDTARSSVAKFDPHQPRDQRGRWSRDTTRDGERRRIARELNADRRIYPDYYLGRLFGYEEPEQLASTKQWADKLGRKHDFMRGVGFWYSMHAMNPARTMESGGHVSNRLGLRTHKNMGLREVMDTLDMAPKNAPTLYRGVRMPKTQLSSLAVGQEMDLPISSFSPEDKGPLRFIQLTPWERSRVQPTLIQLSSGAKALNLTPMGVYAVTANEWITRGRFKVTSIKTEPRPVPGGKWNGDAVDIPVTVIRIKQTEYRSNSLPEPA